MDKSNSKFNFGKEDIAFLHFKKVKSNFFWTLSDLEFKPVVGKSSGLVSLKNSKKLKVSRQIMDPIIEQFKVVFNKYQIKKIIVIFTKVFKGYCWFFLTRLNMFGINVHSFYFWIKKPHSIIKKCRKPRK